VAPALSVVQRPRDPGDAVTGQPLSEYPLHDRRGISIRFEPMRSASPGGMRPVRMRARVHQAVAVGRTASLVTALLADLRGHRGAHPNPRAGDLPLRLDTQPDHQLLMPLSLKIDPAADLGHPQFDAVMRE
jgi:hypothetical protein